MRKRITGIYKFIKQVVAEYISDNVIKYSASLAYYTTLSLAYSSFDQEIPPLLSRNFAVGGERV